MKTQQWKDISQIFEQALELPPDQRDRFLESICGDDIDLRHEIDALLVSYDEEPALSEHRPDPASTRKD